MKISKLVLVFPFFLIACASIEELTGNGLIVDTKGLDPVLYEMDLEDCNTYANEVQIGRKIASSAATGAAVGGIIGAVVGNSENAKQGAGIGVVTGTLNGASRGVYERHMVIRNCLIGRGYLVLN